MAEILAQIRQHTKTAAQWTSANPILKLGQKGIETDTQLEKTGNGTTAWTSLPYLHVNVADVIGLTKTSIGLGNVDNTSDINKPVSTATQTALNLKLDTSAYNQYFKGVYATLIALQAALPTGIPGDYAQVDVGLGSNVSTYVWDVLDGWVIITTIGSGAANTDALPEGSVNLYFTDNRAILAIDDAIVTFTNKRITSRVNSSTSNATPTLNTDLYDTYEFTAQTTDILLAVSGTPTNRQSLEVYIKGTAARAISYSADFAATTITLPITTVTSAELKLFFVYSTASGKWEITGVV